MCRQLPEPPTSPPPAPTPPVYPNAGGTEGLHDLRMQHLVWTNTLSLVHDSRRVFLSFFFSSAWAPPFLSHPFLSLQLVTVLLICYVFLQRLYFLMLERLCRPLLNLCSPVWSRHRRAEIPSPPPLCWPWSFTPGVQPGDQHRFFHLALLAETGSQKKEKKKQLRCSYFLFLSLSFWPVIL